MHPSQVVLVLFAGLTASSLVDALPKPSTQRCGSNDCVFLDSVKYSIVPNYLELPPPCTSEIFCHGRLLHTVQMAHIYNDSKTFVDMKLRQSPEETLLKFEEFMLAHAENPNKDALQLWVEEHFDKPGSEFEDWVPDDWKKSPTFLDHIKDISLREWAGDLNYLWLKLGRKMTKDVELNTNLYSIIPVANPVIVPGGRFREFYYWDSYWIVRGLLLSEMTTTVRGMLSNFLSIVERYGFIPNGGRIYYSARSQPPLLAGMVQSYVNATGDTTFATENVHLLEREFQFWMNNHTVQVNGTWTLAIYGDSSRGPRPESYREDIESSSVFATSEEQEEHYSELKAGAESGMDFTSRFFVKDGTNAGDLTNLKTRSIVPVELNAILYWNAKIIAEFYGLAGNQAKVDEYEAKAKEILEAIQNVLWHDDIGAWLDYDLINEKRREHFCASNLAPLWMKCYNPEDEAKVAEKVLKYIETTELDKYPGGIPNTFEHTGEQWDFPNVWPPMQHILIVGLDNLNSASAKELALKWAQRWITSNFIAYKETQAMFEKYSALEVGGHGGGGEYEIQLGFGWTNGVVMDLLNQYGDRLSATEPEGNGNSAVSVRGNSSTTSFLTTVLAVVVASFSRIIRLVNY